MLLTLRTSALIKTACIFTFSNLPLVAIFLIIIMARKLYFYFAFPVLPEFTVMFLDSFWILALITNAAVTFAVLVQNKDPKIFCLALFFVVNCNLLVGLAAVPALLLPFVPS